MMNKDNDIDNLSFESFESFESFDEPLLSDGKGNIKTLKSLDEPLLSDRKRNIKTLSLDEPLLSDGKGNIVDELSQDLYYLRPLSPRHERGVLVKEGRTEADEDEWEKINGSIWSTVNDNSSEPRINDENKMKNEVHFNQDSAKEENGEFDANNNTVTETIPERLHVSNIPFRFREDDLEIMFEAYGTVLNAEVIFNEKGSKGFGFVTLDHSENADKAKKALDGVEIEGRRIEVNNATKRTIQINQQSAAARRYMAMVENEEMYSKNYAGEYLKNSFQKASSKNFVDVTNSNGICSGGNDEAIPKRLHVSNIPFRFQENDLKKLFENYGTVLDAEVIYNERGSKGFGFVTVDNAENANKAKRELDGVEVEGRKIEVNSANKRTLQVKQQATIVREFMTNKTLKPRIPNLDSAALAAIAAAEIVAGNDYKACDVLAHAYGIAAAGTSFTTPNNDPHSQTVFRPTQPRLDAASGDSGRMYGPFGGQVYNPPGSQVLGPFGGRVHDPFGGQVHDPPGSQVHDPFGGRMYEPFGGQVLDPFGSQVHDPPESQVHNPFGGRMYDPFGGHVHDPFGGQVLDPFGGEVYNPPSSFYETRSAGDSTSKNYVTAPDVMVQTSRVRPDVLSEFFNDKFYNSGR